MRQLHSTNNSKTALQKLRSALAIALGFSALFSSMEVHACAACGCTLSKDWESQGISSKSGFTADISYDYLNQNKQRYGTSAASSSLVNINLEGNLIHAQTAHLSGIPSSERICVSISVAQSADSAPSAERADFPRPPLPTRPTCESASRPMLSSHDEGLISLFTKGTFTDLT